MRRRCRIVIGERLRQRVLTFLQTSLKQGRKARDAYLVRSLRLAENSLDDPIVFGEIMASAKQLDVLADEGRTTS